MEEEKRSYRDEATEREEHLSAIGEQIQRNALTRRLSIGAYVTGSTRRTAKKRHDIGDMGDWNDTITKELQERQIERETDMKIRADGLQPSKDKWKE